ncbi:hypothetical protein [Nocardia sp. CNY236]|uniref:hypothetical protein n=1 Tax=Nocardia sp. CNY236 TaxID=1169152 RepID=UPI0003F83ECF|nr:hypothetical protein [Nocardia sp. CNY236]
MHSRTLARATAIAVSVGIGTALMGTSPVAAAPGPTPLQSGLDELIESAESDPATQAGIDAVVQYATHTDADQLRVIASAFTPFAYAAPTFGCGSNGPITTIVAAASTNAPDDALAGNASDLNVTPSTLRFSATPAHPGTALASGLVVAWVNVNTGASGVAPLDDMTEYGMPSLSKTVESGPGTVLASMWGIIDYPFAHCVMTPTVGLFTVPDEPKTAPVLDTARVIPGLVAPGPDTSASTAP